VKINIANTLCDLTEFYDAVATEMGYADTSELQYDCTKINIADNIQDGFYQYYTQKAKENNATADDNDIQTAITMLLIVSGPKVDYALKANEVEIFDGFIS
jgi:hypothetical protein